jgi:FkbM family methyltransferase
MRAQDTSRAGDDRHCHLHGDLNGGLRGQPAGHASTQAVDDSVDRAARRDTHRFAADSDLVIDLGMNNGDDTAYYLACGWRVVAVEANPTLCESAGQRFAAALERGRLTIVNAAISADSGPQRFYINRVNDHWSSLDAGWAGRAGDPLEPIEIDGLTIAALFDRVGVPRYLKVDVEGADEMVLAQLAALPHLPYLVSVEDCRFGYRYLAALAAMGYTGFQLLDQSTVGSLHDPACDWRFAAGSSGPFGDALPGRWLDAAAMDTHYSRTVRTRDGERLAPRSQWWDIHARGPAALAPQRSQGARSAPDRTNPKACGTTQPGLE